MHTIITPHTAIIVIQCTVSILNYTHTHIHTHVHVHVHIQPYHIIHQVKVAIVPINDRVKLSRPVYIGLFTKLF